MKTSGRIHKPSMYEYFLISVTDAPLFMNLLLLLLIMPPFVNPQPPTRPPELAAGAGGGGGGHRGRPPLMNDPHVRGPPPNGRPPPPPQFMAGAGPPPNGRPPQQQQQQQQQQQPYPLPPLPPQQQQPPQNHPHHQYYHPYYYHHPGQQQQHQHHQPPPHPPPLDIMDPHVVGPRPPNSDWMPVYQQHHHQQRGPGMPEWTPRFDQELQQQISPHPVGRNPGGAPRRPGGMGMPPNIGGPPQGPNGPYPHPRQNPRAPLPQMNAVNAPPKNPPTWTDLSDRPAIGILTQASKIHVKHYGNDYVKRDYIKYLEMAGAYVVLVQAGQPRKYYEDIFPRINGLFLPGGGAPLQNSTFTEAIRVFLDLAIDANDKGDHFPIWGTCLGFEIMVMEAAGMYALNETDSTNISLPLTLPTSYRTSQMLGNAPQEIIDYLTTENTTANSHIMSLLTETYNQVEPLNKFYRIVSTNKARDGQEFISTIEAYNYPFFGVQWHPEKPVFLRRPDLAIPTSEHAIKIGHYFANFFINEARKSEHRFPSEADRMAWVVGDSDPYCLPKEVLTNVCRACSCCHKEVQHSWSTDLCLVAVSGLCLALVLLYVWPTLPIAFPSPKQLFYHKSK